MQVSVYVQLKKYNDLQFCLPGEMTALRKNEYDFYVCYKCKYKYILSIFNKSVPLFPIKGYLKSKYFSFIDIFKQQVHLHFNHTISIFIVSITVTMSLN